MVNAVLPFLMSMMLGRTIDLKTYTVGGDVYDHADYREIPLHLMNSTYTILPENGFPYSYIGLPADLVLRIKSKSLSSASGSLGLDGLLRETAWKSGVVVAVTSMVQTVYRELKDDAPTLSDWTNRIDRKQTHYAASLIYGGWSAIFYRFVCTVPSDEETVRKLLTSNLGQTGTMNKDTAELWKDVLVKLENNKELNGDFTVQVHRFSSVPLAEDISTPNKLLSAIQSFKNDVGMLGQPMFMELRPLHKLDNRFPDVKENHELDREMEKLDELYDDLRDAKEKMRHWISTTLAEFTEEEEDRILELFDYISRCLQFISKIAGEASIYNDMDVVYLKTAMLMYSKGLTKEVTSYKMLFQRLKEDLDPQCEDSFRSPVRGILQVSHNEKLELGAMKGGLEQCKAECLAEEKCRAIGYSELLPVLEIHSPLQKRAFKIVKKSKQCWIYFRSSHTATVIPSKTEGSTQIYDRNCY